jgi:hypothetical protein
LDALPSPPLLFRGKYGEEKKGGKCERKLKKDKIIVEC